MKDLSAKLIIDGLKKLLGDKQQFLHEPSLGIDELNFVAKAIKKNSISTKGIFVPLFEKKLKEYTKTKHAISIINGTQSIFIALKALGVKTNHEILVPALTFVGTVNAISYLGAEPHFIDSKLDDFGVNCQKLEDYLSKIVKIKNNRCINIKTGRIIKAIIPVHIFGHPCEIDKIVKIAKKYKLFVVEDAAEALGSFYKGKHLGTFGDVGCFSFNGNKIITTGNGGAVITSNQKLIKKIKHLVTTAKIFHKWEYIHDDIGYNYRLSSINAAIGIAQIKRIQKFLKAKRKLFNLYSNFFQKVNGVTLFKEKKYCKSNYWLQTIILNKEKTHLKNKILNYGFKKKIYLRPTWQLISNLKPYKKKQKMNLSGSNEIYNRVINLPSSQSLIK